MNATNYHNEPDAPPPVRSGRSISRDDRGISTPVTHSLSIAITTVLIFGLIFAANGYLEDQQDAGARQQVESIGTELASQLEDAARLGDDSQQATLRVDQPETVMSNSYSASLVPPGECSLVSSANTCLEVSVTRSGENLVRGFPVHNDTDVDVSISRLDSSTFTLAATRTGGTSTRSGVTPMEQSLSIGVAKGVDARSTGQVLNPFNRPPIAKFTFEPGFPDSGDTIEFNASKSRDPDGEIEGHYWYIDTNNESSGETYTRSSSLTPGEHNVTLKVVDDEGGISTTTRTISVSGLEYQDDMPVAPSCMSGKCINASMNNNWGEEIIITDVYIQIPTDITKLKYTSGNEIQVNASGALYTWEYDTDEPEHDIDHLYSGEILTFDSPVSLRNGEQLRIRLKGVSGGGTTYENVTIGVRYIKDGISYRTVITDTGETP